MEGKLEPDASRARNQKNVYVQKISSLMKLSMDNVPSSKREITSSR